MDLRRLLNVAYAHLSDGLTRDGCDKLDQSLQERFPSEMTETERRRSELRRTGEDVARRQLLMAMGDGV